MNIGSMRNSESTAFVRSLTNSNMEFTMATQGSVSIRKYNMELKLNRVLQSQVDDLSTKLASEMEKRNKTEAKLKVGRAEHRKEISGLKKSNALLTASELAKAKETADAKESELRDIQESMRHENERLRSLLSGNVKIKGNLENVNDIARSKNIHVISGGRAGAI